MKSEAGSHREAAPAFGLTDAAARVARVLLQAGTATAPELADRLGLTGTAVRRHLEQLMARGFVVATDSRPFGPSQRRGRGRPARYFALTHAGRDAFESSYDDVAVAALEFVEERLGSEGVAEFARRRAESLAAAYEDVTGLPTTIERAAALAALLSADGYAAEVTSGPLGIQLCQHHCPVAHVAQRFPQFCEAEREAFAGLIGSHATRLSTMAAGGGVCTTVVPLSAGDVVVEDTPPVSPERSTA